MPSGRQDAVRMPSGPGRPAGVRTASSPIGRAQATAPSALPEAAVAADTSCACARARLALPPPPLAVAPPAVRALAVGCETRVAVAGIEDDATPVPGPSITRLFVGATGTDHAPADMTASPRGRPGVIRLLVATGGWGRRIGDRRRGVRGVLRAATGRHRAAATGLGRHGREGRMAPCRLLGEGAGEVRGRATSAGRGRAAGSLVDRCRAADIGTAFREFLDPLLDAGGRLHRIDFLTLAAASGTRGTPTSPATTTARRTPPWRNARRLRGFTVCDILVLNILAIAAGPPPDPGPEPSEETDDVEAWG